MVLRTALPSASLGPRGRMEAHADRSGRMFPGTAQGHPRAADNPPPPHNARACTAVGLPAWAYPLGAQVLHGRISLEEFEQPLGGGWRLLCTAPLEATEG